MVLFKTKGCAPYLLEYCISTLQTRCNNKKKKSNAAKRADETISFLSRAFYKERLTVAREVETRRRVFKSALLSTLFRSRYNTTANSSNIAPMEPPLAEKSRQVTVIHNYKLTDDFFWMRRKYDSRVYEYLRRENQYTQGAFGNFA